LIDTLEEGFVTGAQRVSSLRNLPKSNSDLKPYALECSASEPVLITTTLRSRKRAHKKAQEMAALGHPTTLFDFSYTAQMLTVRFTDQGYWLHKGGIYGRAERTGPVFESFRR